MKIILSIINTHNLLYIALSLCYFRFSLMSLSQSVSEEMLQSIPENFQLTMSGIILWRRRVSQAESWFLCIYLYMEYFLVVFLLPILTLHRISSVKNEWMDIWLLTCGCNSFWLTLQHLQKRLLMCTTPVK